MPNLIRRSTSYELVTEVRLVLRGGIVLVDPSYDRQHTSRRTNVRCCSTELDRNCRRTNPW